jgi:carboxyl-terminal processing protease
MGERTYGKGSVQNVIELETDRQDRGPQSALKLTTSSYRRPSGKNIDRESSPDGSDEWGVKPDEGYELMLTNQEMFGLLRDRRDRDIVQNKVESEKETEIAASDAGAAGSTESDFTDPHLKMATDYLATELAQADSAPTASEKAALTEENAGQ